MFIRLSSVILSALLLSGCATAHRPAQYSSYAPPSAPAPRYESVAMENVAPARPGAGAVYHTVKPQETLWGISKSYGVDMEELARINNITDVTAIEKGSVLAIPAKRSPKARAASARIRQGSGISHFTWPVRGSVVSRFGDRAENGPNKGIDIRASEGQDVLASRAGKVVYCDRSLRGFGQTVIIDHLDGFQTVYSYNSEILVSVGDEVRHRDRVAKVGQTGRAREPMLHFEIRLDGEPINPESCLAK